MMQADEPVAASKVTVLRARLAQAKQLGFRIRTEWLGGETGGGCEIGGTRWIFLDLSLSVEEQLGQLTDALASFGISQPASPGDEPMPASPGVAFTGAASPGAASPGAASPAAAPLPRGSRRPQRQ